MGVTKYPGLLCEESIKTVASGSSLTIWLNFKTRLNCCSLMSGPIYANVLGCVVVNGVGSRKGFPG